MLYTRLCIVAGLACAPALCSAQSFTLLPPAISGVSLCADGTRGTMEQHSLWAAPGEITQTPLDFECVKPSPNGEWALGRDGLAARLKLDGTLEVFPAIPDGYTISYATASSSDDNAVFGYGLTPAGEHRAFRWTTADGTTDLGVLPWSVGTVINDCSIDGTVAAGYVSGNNALDVACAWNSTDGLFKIRDASGTVVSGVCAAVSADGSSIVGWREGPLSAFRWTATGLVQDLAGPDGQVWETQASDVNSDGQRVVGWGTVTGGDGMSHALVWDGTGVPSLLDDMLTRSGVTGLETVLLVTAESVSADGRKLSGLCVDLTSGDVRAYVAELPPPCAADLGRQGGVPGHDGLTDNNDFIVFIDAFFAGSPLADFGRQGGVPGPDGVLDNNDFVVFIDAFFTGCAI